MTKHSSLTFAVAGCGARLTGVMDNLFKEMEGASITIRVFDPDPGAIEASQKRLPVKFIICSSWEEALNSPEVEWALVGSWNCMHREHVVAAFQAGKNVFAEKPLATTLEDCLAIRDAWKASGKTLFFGLVLRYTQFYQRIFAESRKEKIGKLISFEFNEILAFNHGGYIHGNWRRLRSKAGTHMLEKCCHDMDIAQWIAGSLPVRVASFGGLNFFRPKNREWAASLGENAYRDWPDPNPHNIDPFTGEQDIVDNQVAIFEFANGVRATFHTNCNSAIIERRLYLLGSRGTIRADAGELQIRKIGYDTDTTTEKIDLGTRDEHWDGDKVMGRDLAATILKGQPPRAGMEEAMRSAVICYGIDQALDEKRVVDLTPLWEQAGITPETE